MDKIRSIIQNELVGSLTALLFFLFLVLSSCSGGPSVKSEHFIDQNPFGADSVNEKLNSGLANHLTSPRTTGTPADYKVGPDDLLDINVFQASELDTKVRVSAQGQIGLPLIGKVEAGGLSISELEGLIAEKYERYLNQPVVSVFVEEYRSQQIVVLGAVNNPKVYYVTGQVYLLDILSMAGGLSPEAGDVCTVYMQGNDGTDSDKLVISLTDLLETGRSDLNVPLTAGNVVHVPKRGVFFIDGAVDSAGIYQINGKTTLTQAVSIAKGALYEANLSEVTILRNNGTPERETLVANFNDIINGKETDIEIKDKDIIIVPKNGVKSFFKGFATSLSFGMFRFGKGF